MKDIDLLAEYVDYRTADGCLRWNEFKTLKQKQKIIEDFDAYVESKSKNSLKDLLLRFDKSLETLNLNLNEIKEDVNEIKSGIKEMKKEINEINENFY